CNTVRSKSATGQAPSHLPTALVVRWRPSNRLLKILVIPVVLTCPRRRTGRAETVPGNARRRPTPARQRPLLPAGPRTANPSWAHRIHSLTPKRILPAAG